MTFGTVGHVLHRRRRGAFSHFFSRASVRRLEPLIQTLVDKLCEKLSQYTDTREPVNMVHAYSALTQDVITEYCFSECRNVLEMENFSPWYMTWCRSRVNYVKCSFLPQLLLQEAANRTTEPSNFHVCFQCYSSCPTGACEPHTRCSLSIECRDWGTNLKSGQSYLIPTRLAPKVILPCSIPFETTPISRCRKSLFPALSWRRRVSLVREL